MILSRYILREHIAPFMFGLSLLVFIMMMNLFYQMLGRIAGKGIELSVIIEFFALNLAWILTLAIPMAVLIATLSAFGRLSGDGEITALRASGISPSTLMRPVLWAGLFLTLANLFFNNYILPEMNHRTKLLHMDISRKRPTLNIEPGIYNFEIPNYVLLARQVDQTTSFLYDVTIYDERDPAGRAVITAKRGWLRFVTEEETMLMTLYDGEVQRYSDREAQGFEWTKFDSADFRIQIPGMVMRRGDSGYRSDREMSVEEMLKRVAELRLGEREHDKRRIREYMVEIHKKFSIPVACLVFVLLGAPLGMMARKGGFGISSGISLLLFTIYWAFLVNGEDYANRGTVPPAIAMWSANVIMAIIGFGMLSLARRRTSLPGATWIGMKLGRLFKWDRGFDEKGDSPR